MNYRRLPLNFDAASLQSDLERVGNHEWAPHYNEEDFEGEWRGVALRALGGQTGNLRVLPGAQMLYADTPLLERCPAFQRVLAGFHCPIGAARLLSLAPKSLIREHCDDRLSPSNGEVRLHVPVQTHPDAAFYLCGERIPMQPGECWFLDFSLPHRAENFSPIDRVHLVLDLVNDSWLNALLKDKG